MAAPNIVEAATIKSRVVTVTLGAVATDIVVNAVDSGKAYLLAGLMVANPSNDPALLTVTLINAAPAHTAALVSKLVVPGNATVIVPVNKLNLEEGDKVTGIGGGVLQATATFVEIS